MPDIQSISLYRYNGPKALIQPVSKLEQEALLQYASSTSQLGKALTTFRGSDCCRLKFQSPSVWADHHLAGVESRKVLLDFVKAMQNHHMQLLCCADLNILGTSAGTLFFQNDPEDAQTQIACLQLGHIDKVRIVQLPESEVVGFESMLRASWKIGVTVSNKYGLRGFKLNGHPWRTAETSNAQNVNARKLVINALGFMESNGWTRVVPFDCSITEYDADSLLFFRAKSSPKKLPPSEFCAIALESKHKIRLIGSAADVSSRSVFENAVRKHWSTGVREVNNFPDSRQVKCRGWPWCPHTTEENIASAKLMCGVLQELWSLGWRWHCAIDMSVSLADKSTFFLSRSRAATVGDGSQIGCLQPKGSGKVNLVSFPESVLQRVVQSIQRKKWCVPLLKVEWHGSNCARVCFQSPCLHRGSCTDQKIQTSKVYTDLLAIVGASTEGVTILGSADISGNYHGGSKHSPAHSLDTDAFFFAFASGKQRLYETYPVKEAYF